MGKNYYTEYHQQLVEEYYYCQTGITSGETRNRIITELFPVLSHIVTICMRNTNLPPTDDNIQDVLIKLTTHILPRLQQDKLQGALHFLYLSTRRYCINKAVMKKYYYVDVDDISNVTFSNVEDEADYQLYKEDKRKEILLAIDDKIEEQRIINKSTTIFLINMKEYLVKNDFDPRGFDKHIQQKMNICEARYNGIASACGVRTKVFNEPLINDKQKKK